MWWRDAEEGRVTDKNSTRPSGKEAYTSSWGLASATARAINPLKRFDVGSIGSAACGIDFSLILPLVSPLILPLFSTAVVRFLGRVGARKLSFSFCCRLESDLGSTPREPLSKCEESLACLGGMCLFSKQT